MVAWGDMKAEGDPEQEHVGAGRLEDVRELVVRDARGKERKAARKK